MANSNGYVSATDKLDKAIESLESRKKAILNRLNSNVRSLRTRASNPNMKARSKVEKLGKGASMRDSLRKETATAAASTMAAYEAARNEVKDIEASLTLLRTQKCTRPGMSYPYQQEQRVRRSLFKRIMSFFKAMIQSFFGLIMTLLGRKRRKPRPVSYRQGRSS